MGISLVSIVPSQFAPNATTTLFTSPAGVATRIDSLSVCNTTAGSATITIYIVPSGGAAGALHATTSGQAVIAGQTWNSPNEIGKVLAAGDFLSVVASAASTLTISASGMQLS